jgi:serine/threonine protein kinase
MDWEAFYKRLREPDFIPGYEIQNRLGGGAFGEVYKARKHSIGKAYAIKFLKLDDDSQREAVRRELEQVRHFAAIDHPNLVSIEDQGTVEGVPYLVMGHAGEDTLARRLREGGLSLEEALHLFVQVARGVLALHDRRLVHFDLKPANVFLKGDLARVGDYGLSRLQASGRLTLSFGRGTPHYMAPEMLRSRGDRRADIYSLGVLLYECVSGKVPFEAGTPGGIVLREEDTPPDFGPDFPPHLRRVVERCLRIDPELRYASVEELLSELGQPARPGDSIRWSERGLRPSSATASELQGVAAELPRGAPELAQDEMEEPGRGRTRVPRFPATIPVPPATQGGPLGTCFLLLRLGAEVLVRLAVGGVRGLRSLWLRLAAQARGGDVPAPRRVLRLSLYLGLLGLGLGLALEALVQVIHGLR